MQDRNMVESVIKDRNINLESSDTNGLNNIFLKNKKIIRSKNFSKALIFEKKNQLFGAQKKRKLFLNWPRDNFYDSRWLNKLMNKTMRHGKKGISEKIMVDMLTLLNQKVGGSALLIFHQALSQIKPVLTVISRRVGRRIYQVPVPLATLKQYKTALKWLNLTAKKNKKMPVAENLATELLDTVFLKRSEVLRKKAELYETVVKNRAYTHYRWI